MWIWNNTQHNRCPYHLSAYWWNCCCCCFHLKVIFFLLSISDTKSIDSQQINRIMAIEMCFNWKAGCFAERLFGAAFAVWLHAVHTQFNGNWKLLEIFISDYGIRWPQKVQSMWCVPHTLCVHSVIDIFEFEKKNTENETNKPNDTKLKTVKKNLRFLRPSRTLYTKSWNARSTGGRVGRCDSVFGWAGTICNLIAPLFLSSIKLSLTQSPSTIFAAIFRCVSLNFNEQNFPLRWLLLLWLFSLFQISNPLYSRLFR